MILALLKWYVAMQLLALAGLPLAFSWLRALPSRGYAAAKALGLLLTGVLLWWAETLHLCPNSLPAIFASVGATFLGGMWLLRREERGVLAAWWREKRAFVLTTEALFLLAFIVWALVRASQPRIETAGGEKWMEIAFLNAILRSPTMPPNDPWLSGFAISYYYLGYFLLSLLTRLTSLPATVAFNLGNAAWFALAAVTSYGIVYDLLPRRDVRRPLLAPLMLLLAGNGEAFLEVLHARGLLPASFWHWLDIVDLSAAPQPPFTWRPTRYMWWWRASRVLHDYTPWHTHQEVIDEFPAFSFLLGDMHPHLLALPFVLLAIALALNLYRSRVTLRRDWLSLSGYALILGSLGFLNTWDFPIYWALLVGALILGSWAASERDALWEHAWRLLPQAAWLGVLSVLAYLPFWIGLRSQAGGILPNVFNATRLVHFGVMFMPLLLPLAGLLIAAARRVCLSWTNVLLWSLALLLAVFLGSLLIGAATALPYLHLILSGSPIAGLTLSPADAGAALLHRLLAPWTALLLLAGLVVAGWSLGVTGKRALPEAWRFPLLMALLGLGLTLTPEFIFLKDIFHTRMNTIFKFYFQAWVLWSLVGAWQLALWLEDRPLWAAFSALFIALGLLYPLFAIPQRAAERGGDWTLDGAAWLTQAQPQDMAAIHWLNAHISGAPVIVESPGDVHRAYTYEGRVSAFTGLPTVLGWADHETQWRGTSDEQAARSQALQVLFSTSDASLARAILDTYHVTYLYIGPTERSRYPAESLSRFAAWFPKVYDQNGVIIYRTAP